MKIYHVIAIILVLGIIKGAPSEDSLDNPFPEWVDHAQIFETEKSRLQPWTPEDGLPTKLADVGLSENIELVESLTHGDGGSRYWIIKDDAGRYFAFWREPRFYADKDTKEVKTKEISDRGFWIGTTHPWYYKGGISVPFNSECHRFLLCVINKLSEHESNKSRQ